MNPKNNRFGFKQGFTMLEILLVVASIGILMSIVILAVNPAKQLAQVRNAERQAEITAVLQKVWEYNLDYGYFPQTITQTPLEICKASAQDCTDMVDLSVLVDEGYLLEIPIDPSSASPNGTGYGIFKTPQDRITITAPGAERGAIIELTR